MVEFNFEDVLTVHPTELNIPFELNKETSSCSSILLTNKTDRIIAYTLYAQELIPGNPARFSVTAVAYLNTSFRAKLNLLVLVSPKLGTILPRSTSTVTVTAKLGKKHPEDKKYFSSWIKICAYIAKDGVKAEDITTYDKLKKKSIKTLDPFKLTVVYTSVNSCSEVPEKNEKESLLDHDNNLLPQCINDKFHGTTSEGEGSKSSVRTQSSNELSIKLFFDNEIKCAINDLSVSSKIGQGGYGAVYKSNLQDTDVAIKMLDPNGQQGIDEFLQELEVLGRMRHPNLVKLIGACFKLRALVYEFLPQGSVEDFLRKNPRLLTWQMRTRIVYEICSALTFLHSIKPQPVVHDDLKPANILLDANFVSKLADFGLCRFIPEGTPTLAFLDTNPKGTFGYIDPEFMRTGILTPSCDVYSFGITILRLLTGMDALGIGTKVRSAYKEKSLMTMVDSTAGHWPADVSEYLAYFGLKCCAKKKSHGLIKEITEDLEEILAGIDG